MYPILSPGRDDYRDNSFDLEEVMFQVADNSKYMLRWKFSKLPKYLGELVADELCEYVVRLQCSSTFYRVVFPLFKEEGQKPIPADHIFGRVSLEGFLVAKKDFDFKPVGLHSDYGDFSCQIKKGDFLGMTPTHLFDVYPDLLNRNGVDAFVEVQQQANSQDPTIFDYSGNKIVIRLSQEAYPRYISVRKQAKASPHILSGMVLPAIIEGIHLLDKDDDTDTRVWVRGLKALTFQGAPLLDGLVKNYAPSDMASGVLANPIDQMLWALAVVIDDNK